MARIRCTSAASAARTRPSTTRTTWPAPIGPPRRGGAAPPRGASAPPPADGGARSRFPDSRSAATLAAMRQAIERFVARALGLPDGTDVAVVSPPDRAMGDYAVAMFPFAKALKAAPPALAAKVVAAFAPGDGLTSAVAAGPFVNFKVDRRAFFAETLGR